MKQKNILKILIILSMLIIVGISLVSCSVENQLLFTQDSVIGRYADGMEIISYKSAPASAIEYKESQRVEKNIYINHNVKGLHFTGLYLPAGETLSIEVPMEIAQIGVAVYVNANTDKEEIYNITNKKTTITSQNGGIVDFFYNSNNAVNNYFDITIGGCVESPYYRYGIDSPQNNVFLQSNSRDDNIIAVLDSGNIRFYVANKMVNQIKDLDKTMSWWRSCIEIINNTLDMSFANGYNFPLIVYVNDGSDNTEKSVVSHAENSANSLFDYNTLLTGSAHSLVEKVAISKMKMLENHKPDAYIQDFGKAISAIAMLNMTDNNLVVNEQLNALGNSYDSLEKLINNDLDSDIRKISFFTNFMHYFGYDNAIKLVKSAKAIRADEQSFVSELYDKCTQITGYDLREYFGLYELEIPQDKLQKNREIFVPVQTKYTITNNTFSKQTGNIVNYGDIATFDFMSELVSPRSGWEFVSLEGASNQWAQIGVGKFEYTPSDKKLSDEFFVVLKNGNFETRLYGKISVNINVVSYKQYNNVSYGGMDKAIKEIDKLNLDYSKSLTTATNVQVFDNPDNQNNYAVSVTKGSMQVAESGKYTFYLKNSGHCRVVFGVEDYYFDMFDNFLTIKQYTDELHYEVKLEKGKIYYFDIYVLAIIGSGSATLGIKEGDNIVDLGGDYIVYKGFDRQSMIEYSPPQVAIKEFEKEGQVINFKNASNWKVSTDSPSDADSSVTNIVDDKTSTVFRNKKPSRKININIDFGQNIVFEYMEVVITQNSLKKLNPTKVQVLTSNDDKNYTQLGEFELNKIQNIFSLDASGRYLRLSFERQEEFILEVSQVKLGEVLGESVIVPNTSSKIEYRGIWGRENKYLSINGSVNVSQENNCLAKFEFYGSAISIYATRSKDFGRAKIYIDNQVYDIDLSSKDVQNSQRVFSWDFKESGYHTIKIVPEKNSVINIDYLTYIPDVEPEKQPPSNSRIVMIVIIPTIIVIIGIVCIGADIVVKRKKSKNK